MISEAMLQTPYKTAGQYRKIPQHLFDCYIFLKIFEDLLFTGCYFLQAIANFDFTLNDFVTNKFKCKNRFSRTSTVFLRNGNIFNLKI